VECAKLGVASAESRKRIALQLQVVIRKRRDVLLLENLHRRKLDAWKIDLDREIDREAAELYLSSQTALQSGAVPPDRGRRPRRPAFLAQ